MFAVDSVIYESEQNYVGLSNGFTLSNRADPDRFVQPSKIIFDKQDNLYLVDRGNQRIQKFTVGSKVASTIFSNPSINPYSLFINDLNDLFITSTGATSDAIIKSEYPYSNFKKINCNSYPNAITSDKNGNIIFGIWNSSTINKYEFKTGMQTQIAGQGGYGDQLNQLTNVQDIFMDDSLNLYVSDYYNHRILLFKNNSSIGINVFTSPNLFPKGVYKKYNNLYIISSSGKILKYNLSTFSVNIIGTINSGEQPISISLNSKNDIFVCKENGNEVVLFKRREVSLNQKINLPGKYYAIVEFANGFIANTDTMNVLGQADIFFDKTRISESQISTITANLSTSSSTQTVIKFKPSGNAIINSDYEVNYNGKGSVSTVAGGNGAGAKANQLNYPWGVAVDSLGSVYISDYNNTRIQKWASGSDTGINVTGGNGVVNKSYGVAIDNEGYIYAVDGASYRILKISPISKEAKIVAGGNGRGSDANQFDEIRGVAVDKSGNVYIADMLNNRVQKWAPGSVTGVTVAGGNGPGSANNQLNPSAVAVDEMGSVYVADAGMARIQKWLPGANSGITVAGGNGEGSAANQLAVPQGVAVDKAGNVYIADMGNNRIQKWTPGANAGVTIAGGNGQGAAGSQLDLPTGVAVDALDNIYIVDRSNHRIQKVTNSPQINIPVGQTSGTMTLIGKEDKLFEGNEIINLTPNINGAYLLPSKDISITLLDCNPPKLIFNTSSYSFCSADSIKLSITNINKGDTLKWYYGTKSDLTNVSNKTFTDSTKLFVTRTDSLGCVISSDTISITKNTIPALPTVKDTVFCQNISSSTLLATGTSGNTITWYGSNATGGTGNSTAVVAPTTDTITKSYYVSQINNTTSCESPRAKITVKINPAPVSPSVKDTAYCNNISADTLKATSLIGHTLNWYGTSATGGTASILGSKPTTTTVGSFIYYVSQKNNTTGCEGARAKIGVTINPLPVAPTVSDTNYCNNASSDTLRFNTSTGATLLWYGTNATGGTGTSIAIKPNTANVGTANYYLSQIITAIGCEGPRSKITITIKQVPAVPSIASIGSTRICSGQNTILKTNFTDLNQWYFNNQPINEATDTSYLANASGDYTVARKINGCESAQSSKINIVVENYPIAPTVKDTAYCQGAIADSLKANVLSNNSLLWYGNNETGGSSSTSSLKPVTNNVGVSYYYVSQKTNLSGCESVRAKIAVTVKLTPQVPIISRDSVGNLISTNTYGNSWYKDGAALTDTSQKYKPTTPGSYTAKTTQNGCASALSNPYYYLVTDVINLSADEFIKLAPNPFINQLNFDFVIRGYQRLNLEVFDVATGMKKASMQNLTPGIPIYLGQLSTGTYYVRVSSKDGKINYQFKMIKL